MGARADDEIDERACTRDRWRDKVWFTGATPNQNFISNTHSNVPAILSMNLAVLKGHTAWVTSVAFSPDGAVIASGSCDDTVRTWDVKTGKTLKVFEGHTYNVKSVAFSPEGRRRRHRLWLAIRNGVHVGRRVGNGAFKCLGGAHRCGVLSVAFLPPMRSLLRARAT